eukprot:CAMPEP_0184682540 /NCGR_PEP_ID=MMETSP0312-20130426/7636_1 /TAXON_ID=31354 /ORGANISM="Compsopogon coeruleus, Strain SAG 36.94" /LENGTH=312 /DNA_ID=CAMNT_0027134269 /DNA_START=449 /DNA_END=1384 /DNA_ORIENTATION=+
MYFRKSVLDTVVVQQQKRIAELERKLGKSRKEVLRLKAVYATASAAKGHVTSLAAGGATSTPNLPLHPTTVPKPDMEKVRRLEPPPTSLTGAGVGLSVPVGGVKKKRPVQTVATVRLPEGQSRYWSAEEHQRFLKGVARFGPRNYAAISECVKTRTPKQVRTHAQKYEMRLAREASRQCGGSGEMPYISQHAFEVDFESGDAASSPDILKGQPSCDDEVVNMELQSDHPLGMKASLNSSSMVSLAVTSVVSDGERRSDLDELGLSDPIKMEDLEDIALTDPDTKVDELDSCEGTELVIAGMVTHDATTSEVW